MKKFLAIFLSLTCLLSAVACGGGDEGSSIKPKKSHLTSLIDSSSQNTSTQSSLEDLSSSFVCSEETSGQDSQNSESVFTSEQTTSENSLSTSSLSQESSSSIFSQSSILTSQTAHSSKSSLITNSSLSSAMSSAVSWASSSGICSSESISSSESITSIDSVSSSESISSLESTSSSQSLTVSQTQHQSTFQTSSSVQTTENSSLSSLSSSSIQPIYYSVTLSETTNGSVKSDKTSAVFGEKVTLTITPNTGYAINKITINDMEITVAEFTMPAENVEVKVTFKKLSYTITKKTSTGGSITIDKTSAGYNDTITLTSTAKAGYSFSHYLVNGTKQTKSTFKMPAKDTTVQGVFVKSLNGLAAYTFTNNTNSNTSKTGNVTIGEGVCTNTQNYFPFIYGKTFSSNFYFEAEVSLTDIYNNESLSKCGIAFKVKGESYFFCIDAYKGGFGTNKWVLFANGRGDVMTGVNWNWQDISTRKHSFTGDYTNDKYVKLAVMRVGAYYKFFCGGELMFDMWLPNATGTATVGIHSFNVGFKVKNAKYGTTDTVIANATGYYDQVANPKTITVDGDIADWEQNAKTTYGYDNGNNYFYGTAFEGTDYVYVAMVARTNSWITSNSGANWYLNTNFEIWAGTTADKQMYVSALANGVQKSGDLSGETNKIQSAVIKKINDVNGYYIIYMECAIPYSMWGGTTASDSTTRIGFAFRSGENASLMCEGASGVWWCGAIHIERQSLIIGSKGINIKSAPAVYTSSVTQIATIPIPTTDIRNTQGGWTDGTYFYQLFIKVRSNVDNETILVKFNLSTGKEVARSGILPVDHANDLAYDSKHNRFVIVHNGSTADTVSFLDATTLKLTGSKVVSRKLCGLDYNATKNQYVALISGTFDFVIYDENFNEVGSKVTTHGTWVKGFVRQGIACNDNYIAYILCDRSVITIYDWSGNFKGFVEVTFPHNEGENITFVSKTNFTSGFYVSSNDAVDFLIGADVFKVVPKYRAAN